MSQYSNIAAALKTEIESVTGIGPVYTYEPYVTNEDEFEAAFKPSGDDEINAAVLSRTSIADEYQTNIQATRVETWRIRFFHGYHSRDAADRSEQKFQDIIDGIGSALLTDPTLTALVTLREGPTANNSLAMVGSYLCHISEITFTLQYEVTYS